MSDEFSIDGVRARIRFPNKGQAPAVFTYGDKGTSSRNYIPCKEWCITDDMMNFSDSASVSIPNPDGMYTDLVQVGQKVEFEESDPQVAQGQWLRQFTGRVTSKESYCDMQGGTNLALGLFDLGWHMTSSKAKPLTQIKSKRFNKLLDLLIDKSWEYGPTQASNDLNDRIKHGRQVIIQDHKPQLGAILPFIQVEPGQTPIDIIQTYAARAGVLVQMGAKGGLVFFRPHYDKQPLYRATFHGVGEDGSHKGNVVGRPSLKETIDGVFSEVQCWSTVVIPPEIANTENPNEMYRHTTYRPPVNPLPFERREVFSDGEAISNTLRKNRAIWKYQMGLFNSWVYEVELIGHSQGGAFFVADEMISVDDTVNGVSGVFYVQAARRNAALGSGLTTKLTVRRAGLLNPDLASLKIGGGAKKGAKPPKATP